MKKSKRLSFFHMENDKIVKTQLNLQRRLLSLERMLDFSEKEITNLSVLNEQPKLFRLILNKTPLKSLESLPVQPNLHEIIADNSQIQSYSGFTRLSKLTSISLENTPLSKQPHFRLACLVVIGPKLCSINNEPITSEERKAAARYPLIAKYLIEAGWPIAVPCPKNDEFKNYASQYHIQTKGLMLSDSFNEDESDPFFKPPLTVTNMALMNTDSPNENVAN